MSPDTLTRANFALNYAIPSPDEAGNPFYNVGYAAVLGADEIIVLALSKAHSLDNGGLELVATGYSVVGQSGSVLFQTVLADVNNASPASGVFAPSITVLANGTVAIAWQGVMTNNPAEAQDSYAVLSPSGATLAGAALYRDAYGGDVLNSQGRPDLYATASGFNMEWNAYSAPLAQRFAFQVQSFDPSGALSSRSTTATDGGIGFVPHAFATAPPVSLQIADNAVQVFDGATLVGGAFLPGEPAHAITAEAAAMLAGGDAAVAWVDSGTAYVSLFNPSTGTISAPTGLAWGGVLDVHLVALPDGGFVASWMNFLPPFGSPMMVVPPHYQGEVFTADGVGGGIMTLSGDVAGIDSHGDLYTVDLDSRLFAAGSEYITTYAINGGGSPGGGSTGQTFTSDNNGDHWVGTAGDDTFNLGRGGDIVTGNGGNDTFKFAEAPWAGGHITDFNAGDVLNLVGLMSTTSDTGTDGFADGYLKITDDGQGNAQVWADYHVPGNDGWWLVETLDGVAPASVQHTGDLLTVVSSAIGPANVTTSDSNYIAATSVRAITLTGSQQHIDASATSVVTITSNDTGNVLIGGVGDDVFHLGRGGDWVTGGGGGDTFAYAAIPWAGGGITDFTASQGDKVDVTGLLANAGFSGSDPVAAGYLKYGTDSSGNAQILADYNQPGNDGWWLVATLDGVLTSSLHYAGGMIT